MGSYLARTDWFVTETVVVKQCMGLFAVRAVALCCVCSLVTEEVIKSGGKMCEYQSEPFF